MIDKYRLDDLRLESGEKGELARWVIQLQKDLDYERRKVSAPTARAAMDAEPVCRINRSELANLKMGIWSVVDIPTRHPTDIPLYEAPPATVVPDELLSAVEEVLRISDRDHEAWHKAKKVIATFRAAPPAPKVTESADHEMLKRLAVILSGSDAPGEIKSLTVTAASYVERCKTLARERDDARAAMLNYSENERDMVEPVSQSYKLPATRFQQVADLYGITSPTGSETSFTFDAFEASSFAKSGWSVQEYVELERYQQAVTGNSPVIPDGWVLVPVETTYQMCKAMGLPWESPRFPDLYKAMLAAVKK